MLENIFRLPMELKQKTFEKLTGEDLETGLRQLTWIHQAARKHSVPLEAGDGQYFFELLNSLRPEAPFARDPRLTLQEDINVFFSDLSQAYRATARGGAELARDLETNAKAWPPGMTADEKRLVLHFLKGESVTLSDGKVLPPRREALYARKVAGGDAVYMASQWMRLRRMGSEELVREEGDRFFLLAVHMAYQRIYQETVVPDELARGDLAAFQNLIRNKIQTRSDIARIFRYDAQAKQLEARNIESLPGVPQMSEAQRFGLSVRLHERGEGEPHLRAWFEDQRRCCMAVRLEQPVMVAGTKNLRPMGHRPQPRAELSDLVIGAPVGEVSAVDQDVAIRNFDAVVLVVSVTQKN
jgi:hypothetical protein